MRIWLDPERMARLGVTATDIANVVREQNVVAPAGGLGLPPAPAGQQMQYTVFVKGRLATAGEFENIVIREAGNGQVVRLKDVARVELAAADYSISGATDDIPAALIGIFLQPDANALDVAKHIKVVMEDQARAVSAGHCVYDPVQHHAVRDRIFEGGGQDARHRLRAGCVRRLPVPAELACDADSDPGRTDLADRHLRSLRSAWLFHQHAHAVRPGARDRHRGR